MDNQEFDKKINGLYNGLLRKQKDAFPHVVAQGVTRYYKERFRVKTWNGRPWAAYKGKQPSRGSLMLRTTHLQQSIRPTHIAADKITISAGNAQVPYARAHNEGLTIQIGAYSRNVTFKSYKSGKRIGRTLFAKANAKGAFSKKVGYKGHSIKMPQRQFMGKSPELLKIIKSDFIKLLKNK